MFNGILDLMGRHYMIRQQKHINVYVFAPLVAVPMVRPVMFLLLLILLQALAPVTTQAYQIE